MMSGRGCSLVEFICALILSFILIDHLPISDDAQLLCRRITGALMVMIYVYLDRQCVCKYDDSM